MSRILLFAVCVFSGWMGLLDAQTPVIMDNGIVNAASLAQPSAANGSLAPGSIAALFGSNLAGSPVPAATTPLPTNLGDVDSVLVGGISARLLFVSPNQINFQIPFEAAPGMLNVVVSRGGVSSAPQQVAIVATSPGIFTVDSSGQGVILNSTGALVNPSAPATSGDTVVVFCTGLGSTTPAVATGVPGPTDGSAMVDNAVTAQVAGVAATVVSAALSVTSVGVYQVSVQVPGGIASGNSVPITLSQNGVTSNIATLAVKAAGPSPSIEFTQPVTVQNGAINAGGEPTLQVARDGTIWITDLIPAQIWKSVDQGATWTYITPPLTLGGSDMDGAQDDSGRAHFLDQAGNSACFFYYRTTDGGKTFNVQATSGHGVWLQGNGNCPNLTPHEIDRPWVGTFGANTVYVVGKEGSGANVNVSVDGGQTFKYTAVSPSLFPEPQGIAVDPTDGSLYLIGGLLGTFNLTLGRNPVSGMQVAMSRDGMTFSSSTVFSTAQFDLGGSEFPSIAVDAGHNVYASWSDNTAGTEDVYIAVSRDRGQTWNAPIRISHGLTVSTYPVLAAGDDGHVALAWYGTPDPATARNDAHGANWYVYVAVSTNGADAQPVFQTARVSDQPFHHNSICFHTTECEGLDTSPGNPLPPGYESGILDFFRMAVDPSGALNLVWTDTTQGAPKDRFARQSGGPLLRNAPPSTNVARKSPKL